jgi:mono/diheme cytochrome c family protein
MSITRSATQLLAGVLLGGAFCVANAANPSQIARGRYLAAVGSCNDCHTPGAMLGGPDMKRYLGGSDVGFAVPGFGVVVGSNLTPDKQTGLGNWTDEQIITAFTQGKTPDGRTLAPIMPWANFANMTQSDRRALVAYLRSLKPVQHAVPGPFKPGENVSVFVMTVLPADAYNRMPQPHPPSTQSKE